MDSESTYRIMLVEDGYLLLYWLGFLLAYRGVLGVAAGGAGGAGGWTSIQKDIGKDIGKDTEKDPSNTRE